MIIYIVYEFVDGVAEGFADGFNNLSIFSFSRVANEFKSVVPLGMILISITYEFMPNPSFSL